MGQAEVETRRGIRLRAQPACPMCGATGIAIFQNLADHLFSVPGNWTFRQCIQLHCQLLWLDPMPLDDDLPLLYERYLTHEVRPVRVTGVRARFERWLRRGVLQERLGYDQGLARVLSFLLCGIAQALPSGADGFMGEAMFIDASGEPGRLLEIGCGGGEALAAMRVLGWTVLGVDFDPKAVAVARSRGLEVRLGGVECVGRNDGPFDAIFLGHVIEHVPDQLDLLSRCRELLSERGRLVMVTPNTAGLGMRWFGPFWRGLEPPRHLALFNPECLRSLCTRAGFRVKTLRTSARGARYILAMSFQVKAAAQLSTPVNMPRLLIRFAALVLQIIERAAGVVRPNAGEEIVVCATQATSVDSRSN